MSQIGMRDKKVFQEVALRDLLVDGDVISTLPTFQWLCGTVHYLLESQINWFISPCVCCVLEG
jgi:hypothetical protein